MKLGDSGYRQNVSKKHQERTWLLVLPDKKGLRGGRLYGGQLVKVGSLWGSRERERAAAPVLQAGRCKSATPQRGLGTGQLSNLGVVRSLSKKIKPCQPQRQSCSLVWCENRREKNPVQFSV